MRNNPARRGQALALALVFLLFLLPMGVVLYNSSQVAVKSAVQENQQKTSFRLAADVITDYMRDFSNDPYNGHYDDASLSRPRASYYTNTVSSVTYIANSANHTLYLSATGALGTADAMIHKQRVRALIVFISKLVLYGTMLNTVSNPMAPDNTLYSGGFYANGSVTISGSNVKFLGGPVIINGSFTGATNTVIDGNLYYTGSYSNVTVNGTAFNYIPTITWPTFDPNYYAAQAGTTTTANKTIYFKNDGKVYFKNGPSYTIPPNGLIIYANNTNITISSGVISGHVTVVSYASDATQGCGAGAGEIDINGNIYYAGVGASSITASSANSFAALASNCINFQNANDMLLTGVYFVQGSGATLMEAGGGGNTLIIYGTRGALISSSFSRNAIIYDSGLRTNQPPGLPEQAYLTNFNIP